MVLTKPGVRYKSSQIIQIFTYETKEGIISAYRLKKGDAVGALPTDHLCEYGEAVPILDFLFPLIEEGWTINMLRTLMFYDGDYLEKLKPYIVMVNL